MVKPKSPRDNSQPVKHTIDLTAGEAEEENPRNDGKDPAAVSLGRKGGLKGGRARAEKLTPKQRSDIARKAAKQRWRNKKHDS